MARNNTGEHFLSSVTEAMRLIFEGRENCNRMYLAGTLSQVTVYELLDFLESNGLASVTTNDLRGRKFRLTDKGKRLYAMLRELK